MSQKKLEKQTIVTANLSGLTESDFQEKVAGYGKAMKDNPTIVPTISPAAADVMLKSDALKALHADRDELVKNLKSKTAEIVKAQNELKGIITNQWVPQVQEACGDDQKSIKKLGFGIKGVDNSTSEEVVGKAVASHPLVSRINTNVHLQQKLHIINSATGTIKMPEDAKQINIYGQIDGTAPNDVTKMINFGIAKRGDYLHDFDVADIGKIVYYIVAYINKKTLKPMEMSPVFSAYIS